MHSPRAVREVLAAHGWQDHRAETAAGALAPVAVLVREVPETVLETLIPIRSRLGFEILTGEGWLLLAGSRSSLGAFARPESLPPELVPLAVAVAAALPPEAPLAWITARGPVTLDNPVILGILNLTPDSFSDGGRYDSLDAALARADRLLQDGADIIDLGAESTRPGAVPVPADEERKRLLPVVEALLRRHPDLKLSVDTVKAGVAADALLAGAAIINDVSGLRLDPKMGETVAAAGAGLILMHSRGGVSDMASFDHADYGDDLIGAILNELRDSRSAALQAGVGADRLVLDPGLGFAKTAGQSIRVLDQVAAFTVLGPPVLIGPSRKRFLGELTGRPAAERDPATAAACVVGYERGARLFRVHEARPAREALAVAAGVREA
ncbi:MAG: dihydropteroate synthase [Gemmatimonadales bacterium]